MKTNDFDYNLPERLIAQFPTEKRDGCRLLCLNRKPIGIDHRLFTDLPSLLKPGDHLVFNDTKVLPARMACRKETGGAVELLFTEKINDRSWKALVKPSKRVKTNTVLITGEPPAVRLTVGDILDNGTRLISLANETEGDTIENVLQRYGSVPLPHYIKREPAPRDWQTYQTVFAQNPGAIASPTAGLHFSEEIIRRLKIAGVAISFVTLHVGIGTFRPVKEADPRDHPMHEERFILSGETAAHLKATRNAGGRIIAVGTTVVRVLEHCSRDTGYPAASSGATGLLILPGYSFKAIDGMITNFHVPKSTLLMLVSAFAGRDFVLEAYRSAIDRDYRFFSYGDAMFIV